MEQVWMVTDAKGRTPKSDMWASTAACLVSAIDALGEAVSAGTVNSQDAAEAAQEIMHLLTRMGIDDDAWYIADLPAWAWVIPTSSEEVVTDTVH